jgi:catalase
VKRLADRPVRFELEVQIADSGDDPNDPSAVCPQERERVVVGILEVTAPTEEGDDRRHAIRRCRKPRPDRE